MFVSDKVFYFHFIGFYFGIESTFLNLNQDKRTKRINESIEYNSRTNYVKQIVQNIINEK